MVKNDLVDELTRAFPGITKRDMSTIVSVFFDCMTKGLERGDPIDLRGFGRLTVKKRRPVKGRNPRTAMVVDLPVRWVIHFKPANGLTQGLKVDSQEAITEKHSHLPTLPE